MNTIKNFFTAILKWIAFGAIFILAVWVYGTFFDDGKRNQETTISEDQKLIEIKNDYWENGNLKSETPYKKHYSVGWKKVKTTLIPHGVAKEYYENGVLAKEDPYVEGNRTGTVKLYRQDGSLETEANYLNDVQEGAMIFYDTDGSILSREFYKNGEEVREMATSEEVSSSTTQEKASMKSMTDPKQTIESLLQKDMAYKKAREVLIGLGWKGQGIVEKEVEEYGQLHHIYYVNGWKEVVSCAAFSALVPCRYEFEYPNQKKLVLITQGECISENDNEPCDLTMTDWFFE